MELSESAMLKLIEDVATTKQVTVDIKFAMEENTRVVTKLLETHDGRITSNNKDIKELKDFKNRAVGMITICGVIAGFVGWCLSPVISWILNKFN